ncbi:MAG: ATP-grasp domain-containing protein, partial [Dongiaceae bacterium]
MSARALAVAAHRAGRRAVVVDLFGDTDTRASAEASVVVDGDLNEGFDAPALAAAAEQLAPAASLPRFGLAYGAGLESRPDLLARLADGRRLFG